MNSYLDSLNGPLRSDRGRRMRRRRSPFHAVLVLASCVSMGSFSSVVLPSGTAEAAPSVWSVTPSPNPADISGLVYLTGISCTSSTSCMAVGYYDNGSPYQTLIESWNGTGWSIVPSPDPSSNYNYLNGVSCISSIDCVAVGAYFDSSADRGLQTLVESWNGTEWSITPSPDQSSSDNELQGVSCTGSTDCVAVGWGTSALIESWNGSSWSIVPGPSAGLLLGVSCSRSSSCEAVGFRESSSPEKELKTLVDSWNGTTWSSSSSPSPGRQSNTLNSVSCTSPVSCIAVGTASYGGEPPQASLIESWNGTVWSVDSAAGKGSFGNGLGGVSCITSTDCVAVGNYITNRRGTSEESLIESWNGRAWSVTVSPNRAGSNSLSDVSCISSTACVAVGFHDKKTKVDRTLIESGT
jgi:hypothetical protein